MQKPTILELESTENDACSFYRGRFPLALLHRENKINLMPYNSIYDKFSWSNLCLGNILFIQRAYTESQYQIALKAKELGLKIWLDFDDNFLDVPKYYDVSYFYTNPEWLIKILEISDFISVSTFELKKLYEKYNNKIEVIPNAFNDSFLKIKEKSFNKSVFFRGGSNHETDLFHFRKEIITIMNENKDWTFYFAGNNFSFIREEVGSNYVYCGNIELIDYYKIIGKINPQIMIIPLIVNAFNICKSNIAWIEGTYAGATCLTPYFGQFESIPSFKYTSVEQFGYLLNNLINCDNTITYNKSIEYINNHLLLSNVNKLREILINKLCL